MAFRRHIGPRTEDAAEMINRRKDMRIGKQYLPVVFAAVLCSLPAFCLDLEKEFRQEIALYRIRPDQTRSLKQDSDGTPVSEPQLQQAVRNFYDWLYPLGPGFLKRFKIKNVIFKDTVYDREGKTRQRYLSGDDLYLDADLNNQQFYVTMFYLYATNVMQRSYLTQWNKLNPDGFSYESTRGTLQDRAQKKLDAIMEEWDKHFVSRTCFYSTEMDMGLTFAYVVVKGPDAAAFVRKNSPTVQKKIELLTAILESAKAVEPGYMETLLAEDLSKLKKYVPYALSVRLFYEYSGIWGLAAKDGDDAEAGEKEIGPDEPVEVAGRKINPLILSLETDNARLFKLLMENKADPNVVNEKKVSALMLAIANNDPEQVKILLEAGAKVTSDAARAGTASGVNAEIVNLMKSYLPGVRQSNAPEKKQTGSVSKKPSAAGSPKRKTP